MKRCQHKIVSEILEICMDDVSKTRIVYKANLNFKTVNPYMDLLLKNKLIASKKGRTILYHTTEKGMNLLNEFNRIYNDISELI
jgi:predicted transcriptional regulator